MAIVVPFAKTPAQRLPMPDETFTMAAAALMHENGRLVQPQQPIQKTGMFDEIPEPNKPPMSEAESKLPVANTEVGIAKPDEMLAAHGAFRIPAGAYGKDTSAADHWDDKKLEEYGATKKVLKDGGVILYRKNGPTS